MTRSPIEHLTPDDLEAIGAELDAIRDEVMADVGEQDANYIRKVIKTQRTLDAGGRGALLVSLFPPAWLVGTAALSVAKSSKHGDWSQRHARPVGLDARSRDSLIDVGVGQRLERGELEHSHNFQHHMFANVVGKDRDLGYEIMRIDPAQPWHPVYLPSLSTTLCWRVFEWGVALHDLELDEARRGRKPWSAVKDDVKHLARKAGKQLVKDYVAWPALSGPSAVPAFFGSLGANLVRNVWSHAIIFCGHFPDGAETFDYTEDQLDEETRGDWYLRQLLGWRSSTVAGSSTSWQGLSFQIEHHLFPDVPSNRYQEIAPRVREVCEHYGLPYTSGPLYRQYAQVLIKIARYSLPGGGPSSEASDPCDVEASPPAPGERALKAVAA